jgi:uncharacterized protein YbcV (DUF1398 family)
MDKQRIEMIEQSIKKNFTDGIPFPEWIGTLINAKIDRYYADLVAFQTTYYAMDDSIYRATIPLLNPSARGQSFSETDLTNAIRAAQQGAIGYPEFLNRALKAGVVSYTVYLSGKQVQYMGTKGEIHVEHFPAREKE